MSSNKAIEFTTQALVTAATEVKGVESTDYKKEKENTSVPTSEPTNLKGSSVFDLKD